MMTVLTLQLDTCFKGHAMPESRPSTGREKTFRYAVYLGRCTDRNDSLQFQHNSTLVEASMAIHMVLFSKALVKPWMLAWQLHA